MCPSKRAVDGPCRRLGPVCVQCDFGSVQLLACRPSPVCVPAMRPDAVSPPARYEVGRAPSQQRKRVNLTAPRCDEPFRARDIQFNEPQIRVLAPPAIQIFGKFLPVFRIFPLCSNKRSRTVRSRHAFVQAGGLAVTDGYHKHRAGIPLTPRQHHRKAACSLDGTNQAGDLDMGRQAIRHGRSYGRGLPVPPAAQAAASRSDTLVSRA